VPTDPTPLYRIRDGVYAADLLVVAVADLDLFSWLAERGGASADRICSELELASRPVDVMLTLLVAEGLLERVGDAVLPTPLAREHLCAGSPFDLREYYGSLRERPACAELRAVLGSGGPAAWSSAAASEDWVSRLADASFAERITSAMDARGRFLGPRLAEAVADLPMTRVLDIGGSSGIYLAALVDRSRGVTGAVFERFPIDVAAVALIEERGYADRIDVVVGDVFEEPLPEGFDLHLLSHVLHDWDEGRVRTILARSFAALAPGGYLVDHDVHIDADKAGPLPAAEYSVLLMHSTPGKCWSVGELATFLGDVGFTDVEHRATAGDRSVVVARKPG
jgi:3-hydroxy-5-methyl-1-naphthoate 3-O-methyltransferase